MDDDVDIVPPKYFRSVETIRTALKKKKKSFKGLDNLHASGSASFTESGLVWIRKHLKGDLLIVDLRPEYHAFINGYPCTWIAPRHERHLAQTNETILQEEISLVIGLQQTQILRPYEATALKKNPRARPTIVRVLRASTEQALVEKHGIAYFRLVVFDPARPDDDAVNRFIALHRALGKNTRIHFHCRDGGECTTTFLIMDDMLHHAGKVSFEDIVHRQTLVAPYNSLLQPWSKNASTASKQERATFLRNFYRFAQIYQKNHAIEWSEWLKSSKTP